MATTTILIILAILLSSVSSAYPIVVSEQGINHQEAKELVYSIPEEYYEFVDVIEFVNEPRNRWWDWKSFRFLEEKAWYEIIYDFNNNECYEVNIYIYEPKLEYLIHELGHIYQICDLKQPINDEVFAEEFIIK